MTLWQFASPPPETGAKWTNDQGETEILGPLPECPPLRFGMLNEELLVAYALCTVARDEAAGRVGVWEFWAGTEREAHARLKAKREGLNHEGRKSER